MTPGFDTLLSDDVLVDGMLASDVRSLWRRLARSPVVQDVARGIASSPDHLRALCHFVESLLGQDYDRRYRHPSDIAICAALVLLEDSPLSEVRQLFARLRRIPVPSLAWVKQMAEYCDEKRSDATILAWTTPAADSEDTQAAWTQDYYVSKGARPLRVDVPDDFIQIPA